MKTLAYLFYGIPIPIITAYVTVWAYNWFGLAWWLAYLVGINVAAYLIYALDKSIVRYLAGTMKMTKRRMGLARKSCERLKIFWPGDSFLVAAA